MLSNKYAQTLYKFISSKQKNRSSRLLVFKKTFPKLLQNFHKKKTWDPLTFVGTKTVANFNKKKIHTSIFL